MQDQGRRFPCRATQPRPRVEARSRIRESAERGGPPLWNFDGSRLPRACASSGEFIEPLARFVVREAFGNCLVDIVDPLVTCVFSRIMFSMDFRAQELGEL